MDAGLDALRAHGVDKAGALNFCGEQTGENVTGGYYSGRTIGRMER